jgi:hypothetical protein
MTSPRIFLAVPNYGNTLPRRSAQTIHAESSVHPLFRLVAGSSLLTQTFNALWCSALNHRADGITHFAMLHDDIDIEGDWIDTLIEEMDRTGADILSVVVPMKTPNGLTSTAIDSGGWTHRRLTMTEVANLPETFDALDVPWADGRPLLVNTGCMLVKFDKPWVEQVCFHIADKNVKGEDGQWKPLVFPEDWGFSRWANQNGLKVMATTKVRLQHIGKASFPNHGQWGQASDTENTP